MAKLGDTIVFGDILVTVNATVNGDLQVDGSIVYSGFVASPFSGPTAGEFVASPHTYNFAASPHDFPHAGEYVASPYTVTGFVASPHVYNFVASPHDFAQYATDGEFVASPHTYNFAASPHTFPHAGEYVASPYSPSVSIGSTLEVGTDDTTKGSVHIYGGAADAGGRVVIYPGANGDTELNYWEVTTATSGHAFVIRNASLYDYPAMHIEKSPQFPGPPKQTVTFDNVFMNWNYSGGNIAQLRADLATFSIGNSTGTGAVYVYGASGAGSSTSGGILFIGTSDDYNATVTGWIIDGYRGHLKIETPGNVNHMIFRDYGEAHFAVDVTASANLNVTASLHVGINDTAYGHAVLYGGGAADDEGGRLDMYISDQWDIIGYDAFTIRVATYSLIMGTDVIPDLYRLKGNITYFKNQVNFGVPDTTAGDFVIFSNNATTGGRLTFTIPPDNDATYANFYAGPRKSTFLIGTDSNQRTYQFGANGEMSVAKEIHIPGASTAKLGVGTASPTYPFEVWDSSGGEMVRLVDQGSTDATNAIVWMVFEAAQGQMGTIGFGSTSNLTMAITNWTTGGVRLKPGDNGEVDLAGDVTASGTMHIVGEITASAGMTLGNANASIKVGDTSGLSPGTRTHVFMSIPNDNSTSGWFHDHSRLTPLHITNNRSFIVNHTYSGINDMSVSATWVVAWYGNYTSLYANIATSLHSYLYYGQAPTTNAATNYGIFITGEANNYLSGNLKVVGDLTASGTGGNVARLDTAQEWSAAQNFNEAAITSSSNKVAWNLNTAQCAIHTLTENTTIATPTNMKAGGTYVLRVAQAAGVYTLDWTAAGVFKWGTAASPAEPAANGDVCIFTFYSDGSSMYGVESIRQEA